MVRPIFAATLAVLIAATLSPQSAPAETGDCPANLVPMYENVERTDAMYKADDKFKSAIATQGLTPEQGAHAAVVVGWKHFFERQDPAKAMKRFNQAWLLDPTNGAAHHGMAVMSLVLGEDPAYGDCPFTTERAEALFERAMEDENAPPGTYADYGRFLLTQDRADDAIPPLRTALDMNPGHTQAKFHLAVALNVTGAAGEACTLIKQARETMTDLPQSVVDDICTDAQQP